MSRAVSVVQAKARFSDCLRTAEAGEPVIITRHGKPVVALVPAAELDQIQRLRAAGPAAGLAGLAGGWRGSQELVAILEQGRRTAPRRRTRLR